MFPVEVAKAPGAAHAPAEAVPRVDRSDDLFKEVMASARQSRRRSRASERLAEQKSAAAAEQPRDVKKSGDAAVAEPSRADRMRDQLADERGEEVAREPEAEPPTDTDPQPEAREKDPQQPQEQADERDPQWGDAADGEAPPEALSIAPAAHGSEPAGTSAPAVQAGAPVSTSMPQNQQVSQSAQQGGAAGGPQIVAVLASRSGGSGGEAGTPGAATGGNAAKAGTQSESGARSANDAGPFQHLMDAAMRRGRAAGIRHVQQTAPTSPTVHVKDAQAVTELSRVIRSHAAPGQSSMLLRLDPPELGQLRVHVMMQDDLLTVRFETQTQAAGDAIHGRLTELRAALEGHGVQVGTVDIDVRPPAPSDPQQDRSARQDAQQDGPAAWFGGTGDHGGGRQGDFPDDRSDAPWPGAADSTNGSVRLVESGVDVVA